MSHVSYYTYNLALHLVSFQGCADLLADGVQMRPDCFGHRFIDHCDWHGLIIVLVVEHTPTQQWNLHRGEVIGSGEEVVCFGLVFYRSRWPSFNIYCGVRSSTAQ